MSASYQAVGWNRQKMIYDGVMLAGSVSFLTVFSLVSWATQPELTVETALIRAFGSLAFVLLHLILIIGPLARLDRRFLPLLYNRRHARVPGRQHHGRAGAALGPPGWIGTDPAGPTRTPGIGDFEG